MPLRRKALLALEDGSIFRGCGIGASGQTTGEVVFDTAMTGYQEILTDPSSRGNLVALTYPHIGNTGTNPRDDESARVQAAGLIVREVPRAPSNWRSEESLGRYLEDRGVVGIGDIDTRRLTRLLREQGVQKGVIVTGAAVDEADAVAAARVSSGLNGASLATEAVISEPYDWRWGSLDQADDDTGAPARFSVAVYDYGVKRSTLRHLVDCGVKVTVVPAKTPVDAVLEAGADGVLLSSGPGNPATCTEAIETCRDLLERRVPTLGIGLGHQVLGLAAGGRAVQMKCGHHGANYPVQDLASGAVMISSQNHRYVIDAAGLPAPVRITHRCLFDQTVQGIEVEGAPTFSFQGDPYTGADPHDLGPLFSRFIRLLEEHRATYT